MKRIFACITLVLMLGGCIESQLPLIPDGDAVFVGSLEGQWILESEPETILCARAMEGTSLYEVSVPDPEERPVTVAFLPLVEHHYLLRWNETRADGADETIYAIVRQDLDGLFALMIAENKDAVLQAADNAGYPRDMLSFTEYSLTLNHPDRDMQIALLQAVASVSEEFPGLKYVKVGELPCPEAEATGDPGAMDGPAPKQ